MLGGEYLNCQQRYLKLYLQFWKGTICSGEEERDFSQGSDMKQSPSLYILYSGWFGPAFFFFFLTAV